MSKKRQSVDSELLNDTSSVLSITEVAGDMREAAFRTEIVRLEKHNVGLAETIANMMKSLDNKDAEIAHLKNLLVGGSPVIGQSNLIVSDEIAMIDLQLKKLKEDTMFRAMTLDETKRLDLLIKNKRLVLGDAKPVDRPALPRDVTPADLLTIASKPMKQED